MKTRLFLSLLAFLGNVLAKDIASCDEAGSLDMDETAVAGGLELAAPDCPGNYFVLTVGPFESADTTSPYSFFVSDAATGTEYFGVKDKTALLKANFTLSSSSGRVNITSSRKDMPVYVDYVSVPADVVLDGNLTAGTNDSISLPLAANTRRAYSVDQTADKTLVDLKWDFERPTQGFVALKTNSGKLVMLGARSVGFNPAKFGLMDVDSLHVITNNPVEDLNGMVRIDYAAISENAQSTTPVPETTTTVRDPSEESVLVFFPIVNEEDFVAEHLPAFEDLVQGWADEHANTTIAGCSVFFTPPVSCRTKCGLTAEIDRGCVSVFVDVTTSIFCSYSNSQLRDDLDEAKKDEVKAFVKAAGAKRLAVDDCYAQEKGWLIMAVLIPVGACAVLALAFFVIKSLLAGDRRKRMAETRKQRLSSAKNEYKGSFGFAGDRRRSSMRGSVASPYAYDSNFEIIDE